MKRALVLGGGGARGSFQVGMLEELIINQKLDFQIIRGVSVGALNASFLAQASNEGNPQANLVEKVEALSRLWLEEIKGNSSVYKNRLGYPGLVLGTDSLYSLKPLVELIQKNLSLDELQNSGRNFAVGTVSLVSGYYHSWTPQQPDFVNKLLASASIPVIFPPVNFPQEKDILVDGGVRNITPLTSALQEDPDEVYVLLTSRTIRDGKNLPASTVEEYAYEDWQDNKLGTKISGFDILDRTISILTDEIYLEDIRAYLKWQDITGKAAEVNRILDDVEAPAPQLSKVIKELMVKIKGNHRKPVPLFVLAPRIWFDENNKVGQRNSSTEFDPVLIRNAVEHGRQVASDPSLWVWPPLE